MYKYILEGAGNINWMAIFALFTFFFIFITSIVMAFGSSKAFIDKMADMPLDDTDSAHAEKPFTHDN